MLQTLDVEHVDEMALLVSLSEPKPTKSACSLASAACDAVAKAFFPISYLTTRRLRSIDSKPKVTDASHIISSHH